ncbi:unnamed protein product, partial [Scytosiphon promiscuus]
MSPSWAALMRHTSSLSTMATNRRQRPRNKRRRCGSCVTFPLLACLGGLVQTGTGFVGHVPGAPGIAAARSAAAAYRHRRSWPTAAPAGAASAGPKREQSRRPCGTIPGERGALFASCRQQQHPHPSSTSGAKSPRARAEMVGGPATAVDATRRRSTTTALHAAADGSGAAGKGVSGSAGSLKIAEDTKPRRRRGPGRKTLAAARDVARVPEATKAASHAIAQAASAGRAAAVEAMEREEADREALNALAGEQRRELQASIAEGRGPTVLVSREGFDPLK